jgi:hypothetical protein
MDPENWTFDVITADHDDVKRGIIASHRSRVTISRIAFPDWRVAAQVAAGMAVSRWGGMPTSILNVY